MLAQHELSEKAGGLYGRTYKVLFEGQCEKIPYWLVNFEVMAVTNGDGNLVIEVCDE